MTIKYGRPVPGSVTSLSRDTVNDLRDIAVNYTDIWVDQSTVDGWTDLDSTGKATILIPFNGLHSRIYNASATNPKVITIHFNKTVSSHQMGLGAYTGNFSNVKITLLGSGGVERGLVDESTDSTKYSSRNYQFHPELYNAIRLEFYTADPVTISNITIQKSTSVAARIKAINPSGTLVDIGATESGSLMVTDTENGLAIASGEVTGKSFVHKFGNAPDFDTADLSVTIWDGADDADTNQMRYVYSTTAAIDSISTSSAVGSQIVQLQGLDASYNLVTQQATLTGQTRVALTTPLLRVFRMKVVGAIDNVGHVYCYENTALSAGVPIDRTKIRAAIQPENNQTLMAVYTVPAGYTAYMRDWYASASGASKSTNYIIEVRARELGGVFQLKHISAISDTGTSYIQHIYTEPEKFTEKTDIELRARMTAVGGTGGSVSAGFDIVLVEN